jgi:periplasmic copper chaperone A
MTMKRPLPLPRRTTLGLVLLALAPWCATPLIAQTPPTATSLVAGGNAPVAVEGAWVRATVPGQTGTGGFLTLTAREPLQLVGLSSPVAGVAEVHEMRMDNNRMQMRAIPALDLPVGRPVVLRPGGHHLMLMDLKQTLMRDTTVPVTLQFLNATGQTSTLQLNMPVNNRAPGTATLSAAQQMDGHRH